MLIIVSVSVFGVSGCTDSEAALDQAMLPAEVQGAPETVRQAYRFAVDHPEILEYQPCYCGCGAMGHASNLDCYIQDTADDGTITFDNHALGCGICVDITQDVIRLNEQGLSQREIRAYIDGKYTSFGPSTDTPLPEL